eukprot:GFUD01001749.1.p2 GENE.GFUD01001749.1~~GFUD01001749.1.p2  ORF type:complete len:134 (-),score=28.26 GFUD01001749.1:377-778(-)
MKTEPVLPNSMNIKQENSAVENKILTDCKLALQQDLHGNFPLHNAVLLSNVYLVKRFSLVLSALNKSVDLIVRFVSDPSAPCCGAEQSSAGGGTASLFSLPLLPHQHRGHVLPPGGQAGGRAVSGHVVKACAG